MSSYVNMKTYADDWATKWRRDSLNVPVGPEAIWGDRILASSALAVRYAASQSPADEMHLAASTHFAVRWAQIEYPTFMLSHGVTTKLLLTDCTGLSYEELKLPFSAFSVQLPGPDYALAFTGPRGPVPIAHLTCHMIKSPIKPIIQWNRSVLPDLSLFTVPSLYITSYSSETEVCIHSHSALPNDQEQMRMTLKRLIPIAPRISPGLDVTDLDNRANLAVLRLIVNLCVYLGDARARGLWDPDIPTNAKVRARKKGELVPRRYEVGREIKVGPELHRIAQQMNSGATWKLEARFLVRGHWRMQSYGPGHTGRRRQWIEPHWKGPEEGTRLERAYRLGGSEEVT